MGLLNPYLADIHSECAIFNWSLVGVWIWASKVCTWVSKVWTYFVLWLKLNKKGRTLDKGWTKFGLGCPESGLCVQPTIINKHRSHLILYKLYPQDSMRWVYSITEVATGNEGGWTATKATRTRGLWWCYSTNLHCTCTHGTEYLRPLQRKMRGAHKSQWLTVTIIDVSFYIEPQFTHRFLVFEVGGKFWPFTPSISNCSNKWLLGNIK